VAAEACVDCMEEVVLCTVLEYSSCDCFKMLLEVEKDNDEEDEARWCIGGEDIL